MKKPLFTVCPVCGEICFQDQPHDEVIIKEYNNRKRVLYVHNFCTPQKFKEVDDECGMMWDEL